MSVINTYVIKFNDPDEQQIAALGTGFISGAWLSAEVDRPGATLTNKRIYVSGKIYNLGNRYSLSLTKQKKIFDLQDVDNIIYYTYRPLHLVLFGIAGLAAGLHILISGIGEYSPFFQFGAVGIVAGIVMLFIYFGEKKRLLLVKHTGGRLAFNTKWFPQDAQKIFIREFYKAQKELKNQVSD